MQSLLCGKEQNNAAMCTQLLFIYLHFLLFLHVSCVIGRRFCCHTFVPVDSYSGIYMSLATYRMPHQHESLSHSLSLEYTKKTKKQCHPEAFQKINYKHFQSSHTEDVPVVEKCTEFYIHWSCWSQIFHNYHKSRITFYFWQQKYRHRVTAIKGDNR